MLRILSDVVAGCGFSLAGLLIQGILRNPLAFSSTLGITYGASLSVIVFGNRVLPVSFFAFLGSVIASFIDYAFVQLSKVK